VDVRIPRTRSSGQAAKRTLTAGGLGFGRRESGGGARRFIVLDMFANVCTGREDAKGAIKIASARRCGCIASARLGEAECLLRSSREGTPRRSRRGTPRCGDQSRKRSLDSRYAGMNGRSGG